MNSILTIALILGGPAAGELSPSATLLSAGGKSREILKLEEKLKAAEARFSELQMRITQAYGDVQAARMDLEAGHAAEELKALAGKNDAESKAMAGALEFKVKTLKSIVSEDFPAIRELEQKMVRAQAGQDTQAMNAIQQALTQRKRALMRKQVEIERALAEAKGDTNKARVLEARLEQLRQQEAGTGQPANRAPKPQ